LILVLYAVGAVLAFIGVCAVAGMVGGLVRSIALNLFTGVVMIAMFAVGICALAALAVAAWWTWNVLNIVGSV
jgi:hypothetical protein